MGISFIVMNTSCGLIVRTLSEEIEQYVLSLIQACNIDILQPVASSNKKAALARQSFKDKCLGRLSI